jgi:RNA polymerase sigma factor (TIGR02999 family)
MSMPEPALGSSPDPEPTAELYSMVEGELRAIAANMLRRERADHTLQPTALMHEAWLRLARAHSPWQDRSQFVRAAAGTMRRVLVEHARARARRKRGGGADRLTLSTDIQGRAPQPHEVLAVDEAMQRLAALDPDLEQIVELRVFGGLDHADVAAVTGRSLRTVERSWRLARAVLRRILGGDDEP